MPLPANAAPSQSYRFRRAGVVLLVVLGLTQWVVATGVLMIQPLFPALSRSFQVTTETVVLLSTAYASGGLLVPLFGHQADRHGRRPFLLGGLALFIAGNLACAAASTFSLLLAGQAVVGLSYGITVFLLRTYVGDFFPYAVRGRAMGTVDAAFSLALIAGVPVATTLVDRLSVRAAFLGTAGLAAVVLLTCSIALPRKHTPVPTVQTPTSPARSARIAYAAALKRLDVRASLLSLCLWAMIPTGLFSFLGAWMQGSFGLSDAWLGSVFSVAGVGSLAGRMLAALGSDRLGKKRTVLAGLPTMALLAIALPWSGTIPLALGCLLGFTIGLDAGFSALYTLLSELEPQSRATVMSLGSLATGVGSMFSPLLARFLWQVGGFGLITAALGGVGLTIMLIVTRFVTERRIP